MALYHFEAGQLVSLQSRAHLSPATPMLFKVKNRLPDKNGVAQYRIKNAERGHERVELGSNLVAVEDAY
jgi:hypothetical protein